MHIGIDQPEPFLALAQSLDFPSDFTLTARWLRGQ
jgi:hypothetical protein